jgi:hypothetical protein
MQAKQVTEQFERLIFALGEQMLSLQKLIHPCISSMDWRNYMVYDVAASADGPGPACLMQAHTLIKYVPTYFGRVHHANRDQPGIQPPSQRFAPSRH